MEKDLRQLYPGRELQQLVADYYVKKIELALVICAIGILLGLAVGVNAENSRILREGKIVRGSFGEDVAELEITTVLKDGQKQHFTVVVGPRELAVEEAQVLCEEFLLKLPDLILGQNATLSAVSQDLLLKESFPDCPFCVEWTSSRPDILTGSGKVTAVSQQENVLLHAEVAYGELTWETEIPVSLVPESVSSKERVIADIEELLKDSEASSRKEPEWELPQTYGEEKLVWEQASENNSPIFVIGTLGVAILVFVLKDKDLHNELEKKRNFMKQVYPDIVQRLALYLGAGLTVRAAFQMIAEGYEEIQYVCREMQAGMSESQAYERLAKRIGTQEYLRLSTLLIQNLKKGNSTLLQRLREEVDRATFEKMQNCRKLGEEATTKLLVPMMLFLVVVMVMIMLPAFSSMGV